MWSIADFSHSALHGNDRLSEAAIAVAERFIRTLKENLQELRAERVAFARRYNETWLVARHGYKTPARIREEQTTPRIAIDPTSQRPYPWPPEQAQPGVSEPCRTTLRMLQFPFFLP